MRTSENLLEFSNCTINNEWINTQKLELKIHSLVVCPDRPQEGTEEKFTQHRFQGVSTFSEDICPPPIESDGT